MVYEFELPDVGEGLTEAEILRWLVEPGDTVEEDQPIAEVETDKAVVEVPSPVDGTVREILVEEGDVVEVGTVIVTYDVDGEPAEPTEPDAEGAEVAEPDAEADAEVEIDAEADESTDARVFASPSVRRLARELGVDIGSIDGSGPGGRITEADVEAAAEAAPEAESEPGPETAPEPELERAVSEPEAAVGDVPGAADRDRTLARPATRKLARELDVDIDAVPTDETRDGEAFVEPEHVRAYAETREAAQEVDAEPEPATSAEAEAEGRAPGDRIPYRGIRRTIGERMEQAKFTAPHATHHDEADVTRLVEVRSRLNERASEREISLSYLHFVMKAVVAGLREYPILNARLDEDEGEIVLYEEYNLGVATATDRGLVVPVVEGVDEMGLLEVAERTDELVAKARDGSIALEEMQGGTFSITNFGSIGGQHAAPIINYPEVAILGLGAIEKKPRVVDDGDEPTLAPDGSVPGEVVPRYVLPLSLSIDHRVVDGADAAQFVNTVIEHLENPELLLLE